ncbi:signal peptidase I [Arthrobacter bambusae]|uniref:signal peptidase I n=1 Tax=Arthrobacter bambusae TaxID=1338426 RepID=UPI002789E2B2|nr:signal peptidase I [Arthrobacter bambusae]MDQ0032150.1 signal peptidase [Arthrobacter bambusae]MDQ0097756.1 signal peptidase [Arthrobacter bambusae]
MGNQGGVGLVTVVLKRAASRPRGASDRRRLGDAVRETLLNLAAVGGAICILLTLAAVFFHITLIMFKTGSMSPTIPAGSLAVVREVPVSEVRIGDIVTVDRPGQLPVTHRVTSSRMIDGTTAVLTLKGDANRVEDPAPYTVSKVRTVLYSVPGIAYLVAGASNPWVLGGTTLAVSALVTWALWPRQESARPERDQRARHKARA